MVVHDGDAIPARHVALELRLDLDLGLVDVALLECRALRKDLVSPERGLEVFEQTLPTHALSVGPLLVGDDLALLGFGQFDGGIALGASLYPLDRPVDGLSLDGFRGDAIGLWLARALLNGMGELVGEQMAARFRARRELSAIEIDVVAVRKGLGADARAQTFGSASGVDSDTAEVGAEPALHEMTSVIGQRTPPALRGRKAVLECSSVLGGVRRRWRSPGASHHGSCARIREGLRLNLHVGPFILGPAMAGEPPGSSLTADEANGRRALNDRLVFLLALDLFLLLVGRRRGRRFDHSHHVRGNRVCFLLLGILGMADFQLGLNGGGEKRSRLFVAEEAFAVSLPEKERAGRLLLHDLSGCGGLFRGREHAERVPLVHPLGA
jgi:hypothetical protein